MAQFFAEIKGSRGFASRMGSKDSGMWAHVRGWNVGVEIQCQHIDGRDVLTVTRTGGSNGGHRQLIATLEDER